MNVDDLNYEIQCWIDANPQTLSRLRKFYESIVSIHLGGEGLMMRYNNCDGNYDERKKIFKEYKINYPNKEKEIDCIIPDKCRTCDNIAYVYGNENKAVCLHNAFRPKAPYITSDLKCPFGAGKINAY